jgi:hypothetical protein
MFVKTNPAMNSRPCFLKNSLRLLLAGTSLTLVSTLPSLAQDNDEWFDPTDWFAGTNAKTLSADDSGVYQFDYDYGLGENFDYAEWSTYGRWGYEVWNANDYDASYWDKQKWATDTASLGEPGGKTLNYVVYPSESQTKARDKQAGKSEERSKQTQAQSAQKQKEDQSSEQAGRKQVARLEGTIEGLRNLQLRRESGAINTYTVAKVKLGNDKTTVVNLGREALVKELNLKKGDAIDSIGRRGKVAGKNVFVAHRLKAGKRTIDANPTIRLSEQRQQTVSGTVTEIRKDSASDKNTAQHTLVDLKLDSGKTVTVDLGPGADPTKIDLQQGERVTVRGQLKEQGNRQVLIPDLLKVESATAKTTDSQ